VNRADYGGWPGWGQSNFKLFFNMQSCPARSQVLVAVQDKPECILRMILMVVDGGRDTLRQCEHFLTKLKKNPRPETLDNPQQGAYPQKHAE
jgi:hypothetical protein